MVSALLSLLTGIVTWLVAHLPNSPFQSFVLGFDGFAGSGVTVDKVLGWMNWVVPFQDMFALFGVWLTSALAVVAVKVLTKPIRRTYETISLTGK